MKITYLLLLLGLFAVVACDEETPVITPPAKTGYTQYSTPFANVPTTENVVMYEVNLRAFSGTGQISSVTDKLEYLKSLGINVIWLMPIHPIGAVNSVNSPYSVQDYKAVNSEYGTFQDLRNLTDAAHAKGMAVIMDWVANHTAWDNAWIANKSWYTQDASGNIIQPAGTNWADVADLNFNADSMRLAMIDAMKYWVLEANIDGFRCDYADGVPYDFWAQSIDTLKAVPNRDYVLLAEGSRANHYDAGFDITYSWDFYNGLKNVFGGTPATGLMTIQHSEYANMPTGKHKLRYSTNHDESAWDKTPMQLFGGKKGALAASVAAIFTGGVPLIYTAQEVGRLATVPFFSNTQINWNENPDMLQTYQALLSFYAQSDIAKRGINTNYSSNDILAFQKTLNNQKLLVLVNVRNTATTFALPAELENTIWTDAITGNSVALTTSVALGNYDFLVLQL